jgi:hypothetical protein
MALSEFELLSLLLPRLECGRPKLGYGACIGWWERRRFCSFGFPNKRSSDQGYDAGV